MTITTIGQNDFATSGQVTTIIDGQWGSTGKGLIAAFVAQQSSPFTVCTTNAGPNAGHTTKFHDGTSFVTYHLPTIAVVQRRTAYLNAGTIIDIDLLEKELEDVKFDKSKLIIHPRAVVVTVLDKENEANSDAATTKLASTQKGVGAALARKIRREAMLAKDYRRLEPYINEIDLNQILERGQSVSMEIPQGMDLGLNYGHSYPTCTSREVSVAQGMSDAGIHPHFVGTTIMTARMYPIRVGNIVGTDGVIRGQSGGYYPDQKEISWEELGLKPELTTVTKRVRRVFTWSNIQYKKALRAIRPDVVFLNFLNYAKNEDEAEQWRLQVQACEHEVGWFPLHYYGIGPCVEDVLYYDDAMNRLFNKKGKNRHA